MKIKFKTNRKGIEKSLLLKPDDESDRNILFGLYYVLHGDDSELENLLQQLKYRNYEGLYHLDECKTCLLNETGDCSGWVKAGIPPKMNQHCEDYFNSGKPITEKRTYDNWDDFREVIGLVFVDHDLANDWLKAINEFERDEKKPTDKLISEFKSQAYSQIMEFRKGKATSLSQQGIMALNDKTDLQTARQNFNAGKYTICCNRKPYTCNHNEECEVCGHLGNLHTFSNGHSACYLCPSKTCNDCDKYSLTSVQVGYEDYVQEAECDAGHEDFKGNYGFCPDFKQKPKAGDPDE